MVGATVFSLQLRRSGLRSDVPTPGVVSSNVEGQQLWKSHHLTYNGTPPPPPLLSLCGASDAAHAPFTRTLSQGHSPSKCMLMCSLKETADPLPPPRLPPPSPCSPHLLSHPPPNHRCGTGSPSEGGAADAKSKEKKKTAESHLASGVDEVWMHDGALLRRLLTMSLR